jgi:hypothetical protein
VARLSGSVSGPVVADELVFVRHEAVVAVVAESHVYDLVPSLHFADSLSVMQDPSITVNQSIS